MHYVSKPKYFLGIAHAQHKTIFIIMPTAVSTDVLCSCDVSVLSIIVPKNNH